MIFTKIYIDNLYSFHDCEIDLSLKGNVGRSTIPHEHLKGHEKFRFRKVCIISGANASGKTALGSVLCNIQNLCSKTGAKHTAMSKLVECITDKNKEAVVGVEFVSRYRDSNLYVFNDITIKIKKDNLLPEITGNSICLEQDDTITSVRKKIKTGENCKIFNLADEQPLEIGWQYVLSKNINNSSVPLELLDEKVLKTILMSMDSSIKHIESTGESENKKENEFRIVFDNNDTLIIDNGGVTKPERLSSGTYESISVSVLLNRIINDKRNNDISENHYGMNTYFLDERMSKIHSELEISILNLMIEHLPKNAQFFYTTHNCDVLAMNLPLHSFLFMGKENGQTKIVQPETEKIVKENKEKLLDFLKNDFFRVSPSTKEIDELLFMFDNDLFPDDLFANER